MSASEKKWFIAFSDHYEGPYTPRDIRHRIEEGTVEENPFIWCEGMPNWLRLTDTGLKLFPTPPPLPIRRPASTDTDTGASPGVAAAAMRAATVRPAPSGPRSSHGAVRAAVAPAQEAETFATAEEPAYEQFAAPAGEAGAEPGAEYGEGAEYAPETQGAPEPGYAEEAGENYGEPMGDGATAEGATAEYAGPETGGMTTSDLESPPEHGPPGHGNGHGDGDDPSMHGHDADGRDLSGLIRFDRGGDGETGRHSADGKSKRALRLRLWWLLILLLATGILALLLTRLGP